METILRTKNLTKRFGEKTAVNRVSMTIERGDIYGFIGKNGAGKTTTMKLILGLDFPDEGQIELLGGEPPERARRRTGSLIEAPGLYKNCTAYENMKRFSILSGGTEKEIKECLHCVGLGNTGGKKAGEFSLGMRQRLGIAVALLGGVQFMILDEPINGLDPEGIREIRDLILRLNRERGVTFLISSHLLDELAKVVTKYGIISDGTLLEEVTAAELERRSRNGLKVVVDNVAKALTVLEGRIARSDISVAGSALIINSEAAYAGKLNGLLVTSGVEVRELSLQHGGFEDYFIRRIGR